MQSKLEQLEQLALLALEVPPSTRKTAQRRQCWALTHQGMEAAKQQGTLSAAKQDGGGEKNGWRRRGYLPAMETARDNDDKSLAPDRLVV